MESSSIDNAESRFTASHESFFRDPSKLKEERVEAVCDSSVSEEIPESPARNGSWWFKNEENNKNLMNEKKRQVFLEGYMEKTDDDELGRTKSLTDDDLEELKGCLDLGFGFNYEEIPELCNTLPALKLCYSMSQKYLDDQRKTPDYMSESASSSASSPIANWKISSPGDDPEDVKARLKYWAQAVVCTVRLCSQKRCQ